MASRILAKIPTSLFVLVALFAAACGRRGGVPSGDEDPSTSVGKEKAQAVVQKAVAAHGGEERLGRLHRARVAYRMQGSFDAMPMLTNVDINVTETYELPARMRKELRGHAGGREVDLGWVLGSKQSWYQEKGNELRTLAPVETAEREFRPFMMLDDLRRARDLKWSIVDDSSKARPGTVAVRCTGPGREARIYYFDEKTGLLAGSKDRQFVRGLDREALKEARLSGYKEESGLMLYRRIISYQDGKQTSVISIDEIQLLDKIDDNAFLPPER
jgi:hypothetical protein